jgi:hypothetical protein
MLRSPLRFYRTECIRQLVASERHQFAGEMTLVWRLDRPAIDGHARFSLCSADSKQQRGQLSNNFQVNLTMRGVKLEVAGSQIRSSRI